VVERFVRVESTRHGYTIVISYSNDEENIPISINSALQIPLSILVFTSAPVTRNQRVSAVNQW
jgi:hypothetical protein